MNRNKISSKAMVYTIALSGGILLLMAMLRPESKSENRFKVVDTYKNCNVIRYTDPSNEWHYFLRCST